MFLTFFSVSLCALCGIIFFMKAIILAAGRGSRLLSLTDDRPKCLVELYGKPLLDWQIKALRDAGIQDITVVRGYLKDKITGEFETLENPRWFKTNIKKVGTG